MKFIIRKEGLEKEKNNTNRHIYKSFGIDDEDYFYELKKQLGTDCNDYLYKLRKVMKGDI